MATRGISEPSEVLRGYAKTQELGIVQKLGAGKYIRKPYTLEKIGIAAKEELEK
jgi:two-component system, cell cycle sensor histidine kinase and response regulator CckA